MKEVKRDRGAAFKQNAIDKVVAYFAPEQALRRMHARERMALVGGYKSGDRNRRAFKAWGKSAGSADAEILPYLENLRSDSRDLMRNAPLARGAINTCVTSVVGTGLIPQSRPDREALIELARLGEEDITRFEKDAERVFKMWSQSRNCDASRTQNFTGLQDLCFRAALESGDVFALRRQIKRPGSVVSFALQIIEADRVDNPGRKQDTEKLSAGVERDQYGAPVAYHICKTHPGNRYLTGSSFQTARFPAYLSNGSWNVLHLLHKERPEQTRGVPYLAPVIESLKQIERYTEAEIAAAVISAMFTVFVKTESGESGLPGNGGDPRQSPDSDEVVMGSGAIIDLAAGEDIEVANPGRPNQAFDPFVQAILRQVGVALEIPFELLIKHFTASYSAAQAALLEAWKFFRKRRAWLADMLCTPCWEEVITEAVAAGIIRAPGFFTSPFIRAAYLGVEWIGPPRGMIRIDQEAKAYEIMEDRGWKTGQEITAELTGGDWDAKHERRVKEHEKRRKSGLVVQKSASARKEFFEKNPEKENEDDKGD